MSELSSNQDTSDPNSTEARRGSVESGGWGVGSVWCPSPGTLVPTRVWPVQP